MVAVTSLICQLENIFAYFSSKKEWYDDLSLRLAATYIGFKVVADFSLYSKAEWSEGGSPNVSGLAGILALVQPAFDLRDRNDLGTLNYSSALSDACRLASRVAGLCSGLSAFKEIEEFFLPLTWVLMITNSTLNAATAYAIGEQFYIRPICKYFCS